MRATTGLSISGFEGLCQRFNGVSEEYQLKRYEKALQAGNRKRRFGGGAKGRLRSGQLKVFFILMYFKCYPTMDLMGLFFDLDRSNVKRNIDPLTPLIRRVLGKSLSLPRRKISSLQEFLELIPEGKDLFIDGTERPLQRPKDRNKQRQNYSGKKKRHMRKNLVINDENKRIVYVSPTRSGKTHDYRLFKEAFDPKTIPKQKALWLDKGFIGINRDYPEATVVMPKRKPKSEPLSQQEKEQNKIISGIRMLSEHAIGGIKRLRIVADQFRNKTERFNDQVMYLACGLWNYQLQYS